MAYLVDRFLRRLAVCMVAAVCALNPSQVFAERSLLLELVGVTDEQKIQPNIRVDNQTLQGAPIGLRKWKWELAEPGAAITTLVAVEPFDAGGGNAFRGMLIRVPFFVVRPVDVYAHIRETQIESPAELGRWAYGQSLADARVPAVFAFYERLRATTLARVEQLRSSDSGQQIFGPNDARLFFKFLEAADILFARVFVAPHSEVSVVADYLGTRIQSPTDSKFVESAVGIKNARDLVEKVREHQAIYYRVLFDEIARVKSSDVRCSRYDRLIFEIDAIPLSEATQSLDNLYGQAVSATAECTGTKLQKAGFTPDQAGAAITRKLDEIDTTLKARKLSPAVKAEITNRRVELDQMRLFR